MDSIPEGDWKYLRNVRDELLSRLCGAVNREASLIVRDASLSEHEKFLALHRHVASANGAVADCFNDWRRSNISVKLLALRKHGLLTEELLSRLSPETRHSLTRVEPLTKSE